MLDQLPQLQLSDLPPWAIYSSIAAATIGIPYLLVTLNEKSILKKIKIVKNHHQQVLEGSEEGSTEGNCPIGKNYKPPVPVPVNQLQHFNTFYCLWVNLFKQKHGTVQSYERAILPDNFRPHFGFIGNIPVMMLSTPSAAKTVFLKWKDVEKDNSLVFSEDMQKFFGVNVVFANGDVWRKHRSIINPAFFKIERFTDCFVRNSKKAVDLLNDMSGGKSQFEISPTDLTTRMALDVLGLCMLGVDFDYLNQLLPNRGNKDSEKNLKALAAYHYVMTNMGNGARLFLGKAFTRLPLEQNRKMDMSIEEFNKFIGEMIEDCRKSKDPAMNDTLLKMMVDSVDEEGNGLSNEDINNNTAVFFLAGHETTSVALSFLFYSLAKHPQVQEKLLLEINETFANNEDLSNYEKIQSMKYLDCVIKENLRLFPPIPQLPPRRLATSQVIDGYKIPAGFLIILNIYALHRNRDAWGQDADEFKPERFMQSIVPNAFAPFGNGPRICSGIDFSKLEQKAFIISILQKFRIELDHPNQQMQFNKYLPNLAPAEGFKLKLSTR